MAEVVASVFYSARGVVDGRERGSNDAAEVLAGALGINGATGRAGVGKNRVCCGNVIGLDSGREAGQRQIPLILSCTR